MSGRQLRVMDRLDSRIGAQVGSSCHWWLGTKLKAGYGRITDYSVDPPHHMAAHRFVYERMFGPVPEGMVLDHLCRNKLCVNLDHLEVVSQRTNIMRGTGPSKVNAERVRCKNGHDDWRVLSSGRRECAECTRLRHRRAYRAIREASDERA